MSKVWGNCSVCGAQIFGSYRVKVGLCVDCVEPELTRLRGLQARYDGSQRALAKLLTEHTELSEEADRLRGIERAVLDGETRKDAARDLRNVALELDDGVYDVWLDAIAVALEAKP